MSRYARQELFAGIGADGQRRIRASRVVVVGCGALGSSLAEVMVRAGVATLTIVDRDLVEESNLQRQALFEQADADAALPKAVAAERHLRRLNPEVTVTGIVADVETRNATELIAGADLVLDGTDNFETRFLVNDVCLKAGIPWVYGACVGAYGLALAIRPRVSPCLRCVLEELPAPGSSPTCDTVGVIAPIARVVAGIQSAEALKILAGRMTALLPGIVAVDLWKGTFEVFGLRDQAPSCPACREGRYDFAELRATPAELLCGRNAVQVRPTSAAHIDLAALATRLASARHVQANEYLVRFEADEAEIVVFADSRAIVKGVVDPARARTLYAQYIGS
jgi:molybdopterin/thiamine biosynthesis adenylyltransferase